MFDKLARAEPLGPPRNSGLVTVLRRQHHRNSLPEGLHDRTSAGWPDVSRHKATLARAFFERCAKEEVPLAISGWSLIELRNVIFSGMYSTVARQEGFGSAKNAYTQRPEYMQVVWAEITCVEALLQQMPNVVLLDTPIDEFMLARSLGFVFQQGLEPADAMHFAIASLDQIDAYASTDDTWDRFPDGVLYTRSDKILYRRGVSEPL